MELSKEQLEQATYYIKDKFKGNDRCPFCGHNDWVLSNELFEVREFAEGGLRVGGPVIPLLVIFCDYCGYTALINAIKIGIVKPRKKESKSSSASKEK